MMPPNKPKLPRRPCHSFFMHKGKVTDPEQTSKIKKEDLDAIKQLGVF